MKVTCPKCNKVQKVSQSSKLCSYCYASLNNKTFEGVLSGRDDNFTDEQIKDLLNLDKPKTSISNFQVVLVLLVIFIPILLLYWLDNILFPIYIEDYFPIKFVIFMTVVTTFSAYRHLNKKYDLMDYIQNNFNHNRWGRVNTNFEKKISFWFTFLFLNLILSTLSVPVFNNITSIIFLPNTYNTFINSKTQYRVKGGYNYNLDLIDWHKNSNNTIKLKASKKAWDKYQEGKSAKIKIRKGFLGEVVWDLKQ